MHSIGQADLEAFARLSGDFNPVHIDPNFAYKSYFRGQIVYGIYQVLFVLEKHLSRLKDKGSLESLGDLVGVEANFDLPLYKDEKFVVRLIEDPREVLKSLDSIDCEGVRDTGGGGGGGHVCRHTDKQASVQHDQQKDPGKNGEKTGAKISQCTQTGYAKYEAYTYGIFVRGEMVSRMVFTFGKRTYTPKPKPTFGLVDTESLSPNAHAYNQALFPLCHAFDLLSLALLLCTTRIVGMKIPGLHSIYSSLHMDLSSAHCEGNASLESLIYSHKTHRLGLSTLKLLWPVVGTIKALKRPKLLESDPPSLILAMHATHLESKPFKGQRALVIGASSGLGRACSSLLALGGASVLASFSREAFKQDGLSTFHYEVLNPSLEAKQRLASFRPTHIYYFATPRISPNKASLDRDLLGLFLDYYIFGLERVLSILDESENLDGLIGVFQPSTCFLDEMPLDLREYVLAKAALEGYAALLSKQRGLKVCTPRSPKSATNQNLSLIPQILENPSAALIKPLLAFARGDAAGFDSKNTSCNASRLDTSNKDTSPHKDLRRGI